MLTTACNDTIIYYKGVLSYDIIAELISSLKDEMKGLITQFRLYKKLLTLMIESLENIVRYYGYRNFQASDHPPPEFQICRNADEYIVESVNVIYNSDIPDLRKKIDLVKTLGPEEIRELYKRKITDGKFSEKGGAGLGILEMAKIAEKRIAGEFQKIDGSYSYFHLRMLVKNDTSAAGG